MWGTPSCILPKRANFPRYLEEGVATLALQFVTSFRLCDIRIEVPHLGLP